MKIKYEPTFSAISLVFSAIFLVIIGIILLSAWDIFTYGLAEWRYEHVSNAPTWREVQAYHNGVEVGLLTARYLVLENRIDYGLDSRLRNGNMISLIPEQP